MGTLAAFLGWGHIDEIAENVEDILCKTLRTTKIALQMNESNLLGTETASHSSVLYRR